MPGTRLRDNRARRCAAASVLVLATALAACGGSGTSDESGTRPRPTTTSSTPACTGVDVSTWSPSRRMAQLVAVPAQEADPGAITPAVAMGAGGVVLYGTDAPADLRARLDTLRSAAPDGVAPLVMVDEEGGEIQRMRNLVGAVPWPRDLAATTSPDETRAVARTLGEGLARAGVTADLAPVLDLDAGPGPNQSHPDGKRSFSGDPGIASTYGAAFAQGLRDGGVVAIAKGFPGEGPATGNADFDPHATTLPLDQLTAGGHLEPFRAAIAAGIEGIMVSNVAVPGYTDGPASLSSAAITDLLRGRLGFQGLVLTDSLSSAAVTETGRDVEEAAVAAVAAGADLVLFNTADQNAVAERIVARLVAAVTSGEIPAARADDAVRHVLAAKGLTACG